MGVRAVTHPGFTVTLYNQTPGAGVISANITDNRQVADCAEGVEVIAGVDMSIENLDRYPTW